MIIYDKFFTSNATQLMINYNYMFMYFSVVFLHFSVFCSRFVWLFFVLSLSVLFSFVCLLFFFLYSFLFF